MPFTIPSLRQIWRQRNRKEKGFLFLLLQQMTYRLWTALTGGSLPLEFLFTLLFIVFTLIVGQDYLRRLLRPLLWSLRNRLIVTYIFIGVVPMILTLAMVASGLYLLIGQVATHLVSAELRNRQELIKNAAGAIAWEIAGQQGKGVPGEAALQHLEQLRAQLPGLQAILRVNSNRVPLSKSAAQLDFPAWSTPGFVGIIHSGNEYVLAAHVSVRHQDRQVEVLAYEPATPELLSMLLPNLGLVTFWEVTNLGVKDETGGEQSTALLQYDATKSTVTESKQLMELPSPAQWWNIEVKGFAFLTVRQWESNKTPIRVLLVATRPGLLFNHIFKTFEFGSQQFLTIKWLSTAILILLLIAVYISVFSGIRMTRTITRAVADLDVATGKIEKGVFSHRIPIRTRDQLSKLAGSFNNMTERIEQLILEVKEKEKLESELVIAREVQAQLYPKKMPHLPTLELLGYCNPAREVSGDYFDFITVDARQTALAIGDVSGKGISAALLMAAVQASLRAQLAFEGALPEEGELRGRLVSTARLVAMLNNQLHQITSAEKFASFCLGVYDEPTGRFLYTNAGHLPPILIRQGEPMRLATSGMVLGVLPDTLYDQSLVELRPGDLLAAFSDGITEPENEYGEEFGENRLIDLLVRNSRKPLEELSNLVMDTVTEWAKFPDQRDDMTLLLARRV